VCVTISGGDLSAIFNNLPTVKGIDSQVYFGDMARFVLFGLFMCATAVSGEITDGAV